LYTLSPVEIALSIVLYAEEVANDMEPYSVTSKVTGGPAESYPPTAAAIANWTKLVCS
jgi:hypothetical protein